jgi:hypothetical protein
MNTGIGDAINLAWKLKAVLAGNARDDLLDTYEVERIAFARRLVQTTDRVFTFATAEGKLADLIRTRIAPVVLPALAKFDALREWMFRTVSQVTINYRHSPLSEGKVGDLHGGERLPWVRVEDIDNYVPLAEPKWQIHHVARAHYELTKETDCFGNASNDDQRDPLVMVDRLKPATRKIRTRYARISFALSLSGMNSTRYIIGRTR